MASEQKGGTGVLAAFFDEGAYTLLFARSEGGVCSAFGLVGGQPAYAVCQTGAAVAAADVEQCCQTLELAAKTGNPVVTFYNSPGAKLDEGLAGLAAVAKLNALAAQLSGVVPQIAVVTGVCGASSALAATAADVCIMAKDAELFLTPPFLSAAAGDQVEGAGGAEAAARSGVAALVADTPEQCARQAARLVMLLPGNNLSAPADFEFAPPAAVLNMAKYTGTAAVAALADEGSAVELYAGFGDGVVTCLATIAGSVAGIVATNGPGTFLGPYCASRTARFVRLCDAFSIPVVTVLNSGGFAPSSTFDEAGNIRLAARLAGTYADATTARVAVVAGRAVGPLYTALGNADLTVCMAGALVAPAEPGAAVTVLYKQEIEESGNPVAAETAALAKQYEAALAGAMRETGMADFEATPDTLRTQVAVALDILSTKRTQRLPKKHGNMAL